MDAITRVMIIVSSPNGYQLLYTDRPSTARGAGMSSHASVSRPMLVTVPSCSVSAGTRPGGSASTSRERGHHAPSSVPARDRVVSGLSRTETGLADSRNQSGRNAGYDVSQSSAMARHPSAGPREEPTHQGDVAADTGHPNHPGVPTVLRAVVVLSSPTG